MSFLSKCKLQTIYTECSLEAQKPDFPKVDYDVHMNLKDHTPFNYLSRRLSYSERNPVKDIIFDLLSKGIIKESRSEFCSQIMLVKKKNNSYRMCTDLRELNKRVVKERFPIPHIDDLLDNLKCKKYFTKLELKNAFFHVKVSDQSSKYLSFSTFLDQYEYVRLPFGYCNSPSAFMRFINLVFRELIMQGKFLVYLDDLFKNKTMG